MFTTKSMIKELSEAKFENMPSVAIDKIKWAILDDVGIAFQGYSMQGETLTDYVGKTVGRPESTVVGNGAKVSAGVAAGVNAMFGYASNYDEMGPAGHSIERINHTGLAVGEIVQASGKEVIAAIATVFEISARFAYAARALDSNGRLMRMRHQILNCALVSGKLMDLDDIQMNNLVGLAWMIPPPPLGLGLGKMIGSTANVMVCPIGVQAALLAESGFTGPLDVIERADVYDLEALATSPTPYHYLTYEMYLKPWIAPGGTSHHAIDLAVSIVREECLRHEDIDEIKLLVREPMWTSPPFSLSEPSNYWEAIYAIPSVIALILLGKEAGPAWFSNGIRNDPEVVALAKKVNIELDPEPLDPTEKTTGTIIPYPHERRRAEVTSKGRTFRKETAYVDVIGGPKRFLSKEELELKFKRLVTPVIGKVSADELFVRLSRLEEITDVRDLTELYASDASKSA